MSKSPTITLGGRDFAISVLPFGQQRALSIGEVTAVDPEKPPSQREEEAWDQVEGVLLASIQPRQPDFTIEQLRELRFTLEEAYAARRSILVLSGLRAAEAPQPGKPPKESSGDGSMAG